MIEGVAVAIDSEAVVVTADAPLRVVSSAPLGGGVATARTIVNLHVRKDLVHETLGRLAATFVERRGLPAPWTALATAAWTEDARVASGAAHGVSAVCIVTVGLGNAIAAGVTAPAVLAAADGTTSHEGAPHPSTINTIVIVDVDADVAALVNAVITATEVKTAVLGAAGVRCASGVLATGTSTDAVAIAATGRGRRCEFGGPLSDLGWVVGTTVRGATEAGVRAWLEKHRG